MQMFQQRGLARSSAEQEMLHSATDDGMEDRLVAVRDGIDLNHLAVGARTVILRKFAERTFRLADFRQDAALDDDFGMGRNPNAIGPAFDHLHRPAQQRTGNLHFIFIERGDGLRRQHAGGCTPITSAISSAAPACSAIRK